AVVGAGRGGNLQLPAGVDLVGVGEDAPVVLLHALVRFDNPRVGVGVTELVLGDAGQRLTRADSVGLVGGGRGAGGLRTGSVLIGGRRGRGVGRQAQNPAGLQDGGVGGDEGAVRLAYAFVGVDDPVPLDSGAQTLLCDVPDGVAVLNVVDGAVPGGGRRSRGRGGGGRRSVGVGGNGGRGHGGGGGAGR